MRKKNLHDWYYALECGFYPSACFDCSRERDEYIDGKPACKALGKCKHFNNIRSGNFPSGNPMRHLTAGGLIEFENLSERIISMSPWDGNQMPTLQFYPYIAGQIDMDEEEFQRLLSIKFTFIKTEIIEKRIKKAQRS